MDRFERAYYNALKSVTKKHRRRSKGQRVPASERKALMQAAAEIAEKKSNYRRDGEKHVMRGVPGNALVYMFSSRPTADDWSDADDRSTYLRNNGIFIAQVSDVRGYFDDPQESRERRYDVSWWSGSFADVEDYLRRHMPNALKSGLIGHRRIGRSIDVHTLAEMNGNFLMTIALDILGYGAGVEYEKASNFRDALSIAENAHINF